MGDSEPVPNPALPAAARCPRHPDAYAVETCARCGRFVCGDCLELKPSGAYCEDCAQVVAREQKGSRLAVAALVLGLVGMACVPLGVIGFVLGGIDLARILAGKSPPGGRKLDLWALALGAMDVIVFLTVLRRFLTQLIMAAG
jgi:hypothetical protein